MKIIWWQLIKALTNHLIILPNIDPQALDDSFKIVLLFFHILNSLVPFSEKTLEASDLS